MRKKIDTLGRIVLPQDLREKFGITPGDELDLVETKDGILIKPVYAKCIFCEEHRELFKYKELTVCKTCASNIEELSRKY